MRGGKHVTRCPHSNDLRQVRPASNVAPPVAPRLPCLIVPSPVRQASHSGAMRPTATLAQASGSLEAKPTAELTPISGIQLAQLAPDRHSRLNIVPFAVMATAYCTALKQRALRATPRLFLGENPMSTVLCLSIRLLSSLRHAHESLASRASLPQNIDSCKQARSSCGELLRLKDDAGRRLSVA
jgi:hypothetical protein